jgi:hypothetical protein
MAVRLVVFDLFDSPLDRQRFAPVVSKRVAVVGGGGRRGGDYIYSRREGLAVSWHSGTPLRRSGRHAHGIEAMLRVYYRR